MFFEFLVITSIMLPLIISGFLHMYVVKANLFTFLNIPISEKLFGKNKTLLNKLYQLFNLCHYNHEEPYINIGINLNHLFKMLKSVKKRDSLDIFILKDAPNDLNIKIIRCRREGLFLGL